MKNKIRYRHKPLSTKEQVVLKLAAHGNTNEEIARKLQSSTSTIRGQLQSVYYKLDARNRAHATLIAAYHEIIEYDESLV